MLRSRRLFVDTSFWIAVANSKDQDHRAAMELSRSLWPTGELLTSSFVLIEFLNYFSEYGTLARQKASAFVRNIEADPRVEISDLSMEFYRKGIERYERFADKGWSLTDCISFLIM